MALQVIFGQPHKLFRGRFAAVGEYLIEYMGAQLLDANLVESGLRLNLTRTLAPAQGGQGRWMFSQCTHLLKSHQVLSSLAWRRWTRSEHEQAMLGDDALGGVLGGRSWLSKHAGRGQRDGASSWTTVSHYIGATLRHAMPLRTGAK